MNKLALTLCIVGTLGLAACETTPTDVDSYAYRQGAQETTNDVTPEPVADRVFRRSQTK